MPKKVHKAKLFSFEANLLQNGNVEIIWDSVSPEEFEKEINTNLPDYEGSLSVASMLRYFRSIADEMIDKSRRFI